MYKGNRLFCKFCKWYGKTYFENGEMKRHACKNIDHNKIQLRPRTFNGYEGAYESCNICYFYEPVGYMKNSTFKNIKEYIEWLDNDYYKTSKLHVEKGYNNIRNFEYVTIRIPSDKVELQIHLYDWLMNTWKNGNKIKYKLMKKYDTNKNGEVCKIESVDRPPLKNFGIYEIKKI